MPALLANLSGHNLNLESHTNEPFDIGRAGFRSSGDEALPRACVQICRDVSPIAKIGVAANNFEVATNTLAGMGAELFPSPRVAFFQNDGHYGACDDVFVDGQYYLFKNKGSMRLFHLDDYVLILMPMTILVLPLKGLSQFSSKVWNCGTGLRSTLIDFEVRQRYPHWNSLLCCLTELISKPSDTSDGCDMQPSEMRFDQTGDGLRAQVRQNAVTSFKRERPVSCFC